MENIFIQRVNIHSDDKGLKMTADIAIAIADMLAAIIITAGTVWAITQWNN